MTRTLRLPTLATLLLAALAIPLASANPCNPGCGWVTADPVVSSSTAEGESSLLLPTWEHCLHTQNPYTVQCEQFVGPAYAGTIKGPSAECARGTLTVNGWFVADSRWLCWA